MRIEHIGDADLYLGDCRESMRSMEEASVQCVVTSPPYWGLRDYGLPPVKWADGWEGSHGLEPTPEMFVAHEVEIFREVRRVLRDDGTVWLNLGDSYNAAGREGHGTRIGVKQGTNRASANGHDHNRPSSDGLKEKDMVGIPWRVAFALQADGWYLRQDIIWSKPNPMPESVTDRCTKAHEYIFLLSKAPIYYYDADAIREQAEQTEIAKRGSGAVRSNDLKTLGLTGATGRTNPSCTHPNGRNKRSVWTVGTAPYSAAHFATFPPKLIEPCILAGSRPGDTVLDPFGGSGTTAGVALEHGRKAILCELSEEYGALVAERINSITDAVRQNRLFA